MLFWLFFRRNSCSLAGDLPKKGADGPPNVSERNVVFLSTSWQIGTAGSGARTDGGHGLFAFVLAQERVGGRLEGERAPALFLQVQLLERVRRADD